MRMVVAAVLALAAVGRGQSVPASPPAAGLRVVVTVPPLKGLVEPLLPAGSTLTMLMAPGKSEHGYEFSPADLVALRRADVVVYVGLGLEPRVEAALKKHAAPGRRVVCFADAAGIKAGAEDHDHDGHDHEGHTHGRVDPHLWLDPALCEKLVPMVAEAVHGAVNANKPGAPGKEPAEGVTAAEKALVDRIRATDAAWKEKLAPFKGRAIVTHHNAFARPAERYGFRVAAVIRTTEGSEPTPGQLAAVMEAIKTEKAGAIFVEPQFSATAARRLADRAGVKLATLDPLGDGDWFKMMEANLVSLVKNME